MTLSGLLVDGHNLFLRSHYPGMRSEMETSEGIRSGTLFLAIKGFCSVARELKPTHVMWAFDKGKSSYRTAIRSEYKANRKSVSAPVASPLDEPEPEYFKEQFDGLVDFLSILNIKMERHQGIEADDIIAVTAQHWDIPTYVLSNDHDLQQLASDNVTVVANKGEEIILWTPESVRAKYEMEPSKLPEMWSLMGDCQPTDTMVWVEVDRPTRDDKCLDDKCPCQNNSKQGYMQFHCLSCKCLYRTTYGRDFSFWCPDHRQKTQQALPMMQKPIQEIKVGDRVLSYDQSGSWVRREVLESTEYRFDGQLVKVSSSGDNSVSSRYTPNHRMMATLGELSGQHCVYLMKKDNQFRVGKTIMQSTSNGSKIGSRISSEKAECGWILKTFDTKDEALLYEQIVSFRYRIPDVRFTSSDDLHQSRLTDFWNLVGDLTDSARSCLQDHGLEIELPYCVPGERTPSRQLTQTAAVNAITGMKVATFDGDFDARISDRMKTISVSREKYQGMVYSLKVSGNTNLYVADNIVTHNSGDNIEGLYRVGPVKAKKLIHEYGNLVSVVDNAIESQADKQRVLENYLLINLSDNAAFNTLIPFQDAPLIPMKELGPERKKALSQFFEEWEFSSLQSKIITNSLY